MKQLAPVRFEISVNGRARCIGGIGDYGVLSAIVGWVKRRPELIHPDVGVASDFDESGMLKQRINVELGGLDSSTDQHVHWLNEELQPGDVVTIRVLGVGEFDQPSYGSPGRKSTS